MDSALREFGEKSYAEASLNTICSEGTLSKGIIYHYFKDKDELYLACVKDCFDALTAYLSGAVGIENAPIEQALACYFGARIAFFEAHPDYLGVFCGAVMQPPAHLSTAIGACSAAFRAQAVSLLTTLLQRVKLRPEVTLEEIAEVFCEYQDVVNARFRLYASGEDAWKAHEARCRRSLQILLYGVIEREV